MSYSKALEMTIEIEKGNRGIQDLKEYLSKLIATEEIAKANKQGGTLKLQKSIMAYIKRYSKENIAKPVLNTVNINSENKLELCNGFTAYQINPPHIKIEGLPYTNETNMEYVKLDGMFLTEDQLYNTEEKIDIELLNKKLALYKANKKKVNEENSYVIGNRYVNPQFIKDAVELFGTDITFKVQNDNPHHAVFVYSTLGRGIILPVRIKN